MAERGRPPKGVERSNILLRIPTDLMEQVDIFKESLEAGRGGFGINRTDLLIRLIEVGLQTLTQARQPATQPAPASHRNGQRASATSARAIPLATLQAIAATAAEYDKLSFAQLAQLLYERHIYRAKDPATGQEKPINKGTLKKWIARARTAGLLESSEV